MKLFQNIFAALFMLAGSSCLAQDIMEFVVVNDAKDSFVNLRADASAKGKVVQKLANGTVVYALSQKDNWISVEFGEGKKVMSGYIYKSFATLLPTFKEIKLNANTTNSAFFTGDGIAVTITKGKFIKDKHTYTYSKDNNIVETIDGKEIWGTDGTMPTTQYTNVTITFGEQKVELPQTALQNLFNPNLDDTHVYYDSTTDTLYIAAVNSDGAGGYCAALIIQDKKYKVRVVDTPF
ncbi:SH3 domain-containing protein [Flavobacterium rivuli]|uniref:SH3 domain-containing protein n=1 Tax=Flavobacterium rivuli TaxID=498301 RepID=UPI0014616529|nr:SH3 domain-containing protein [Flavobacterium rivuli]